MTDNTQRTSKENLHDVTQADHIVDMHEMVVDNNKASEDELTVEQILDGFGLFSRWYGFDEALGTKGRHTSSTPTEAIDKAKEAIEGLIRTEKLKLLAEARERVIGEGFKPSGFDERYSRQEGDNGHITHYETKKDAETINQHQEYQRNELTKLEAEL